MGLLRDNYAKLSINLAIISAANTKRTEVLKYNNQNNKIIITVLTVITSICQIIDLYSQLQLLPYAQQINGSNIQIVIYKQMNPFEKLRRAVDKVTIQYQMPQDKTQANKIKVQMANQAVEEGRDGKLRSKSSFQEQKLVSRNDNVNTILMDQQTKYIQQINQLASKNERLLKSVKLLEVQKQQLIQQVCILEKNCQILEDKLKQIYQNQGSSEDRQRKYKEEIYRINKTIQMLGNELNSERSSKKAAINDLNKYKQEFEFGNTESMNKIKDLQLKIKRLQQQIEQRSSMLEFNIKKNSEQRRQNKIIQQKIKNESDRKIGEQAQTIDKLKEQLNSYRSSYDILNHKYQTVSSNFEDVDHKNKGLQEEIDTFQSRIKNLQEQLRETLQTNRMLHMQVQKLSQSLKNQKQNIKLKVVEIKDQTLELELQMYKRQCKDLLQQKAISQKLSTGRVFQPSYQIFQGK